MNNNNTLFIQVVLLKKPDTDRIRLALAIKTVAGWLQLKHISTYNELIIRHWVYRNNEATMAKLGLALPNLVGIRIHCVYYSWSCSNIEGDKCGRREVTLHLTLARTDASCYLVYDTPRHSPGINHYWNKECPLTVIVISTRRPWY